MERPIRNSAKALIIRDGKLAAVKLEDSDGMWYILWLSPTFSRISLAKLVRSLAGMFL